MSTYHYKLFGTDGIRGIVRQFPITTDIAYKLGHTVAHLFSVGAPIENKIVIAGDTRESFSLLEKAVIEGCTTAGANVICVGIIPTPALSLLTRTFKASAGIMISASHNSYQYNGFKICNANGIKINEHDENTITQAIINFTATQSVPHQTKINRIKEAQLTYTAFLHDHLPKNIKLDNLKIIVDYANGAACSILSDIFRKAGANIIDINNKPNGKNINKNCGAVFPQTLIKKVITHKADLGIALDGDADRLILVNEQGHVMDGNYVLSALAQYFVNNEMTKNKNIVSTIMINGATERFILDVMRIDLIKTDIGDKHIIKAMSQHNSFIGGEASGHIIFGPPHMTGDAMLAAIHVVSYLVQNNYKASMINSIFDLLPSKTINIPFNQGDDITALLLDKDLNKLKKDLLNDMKESGKIIIRKSGTEPLIRITAEAKKKEHVERAISLIKQSIVNKLTYL